ncbi:Molybdopterin molybdenumtransferase [Sinobacterium norvegicum]|uniref:Molybdopterin molybdenumtransferase n=2 Tax=Sinobacterium norvegicum TaxID=1641715 RepID=A0ABM9AI96_9GAMM|nr:Molybdopterin molybdenumtransferase [Sinobacterium norvegicum]
MIEATHCKQEGEVLYTPNEIVDLMLERIASQGPEVAVEQLELKNLSGRILAEDIISPVDIPQFNHSAMDGYAIASAVEQVTYRVIDKTLAGESPTVKLLPGQAVVIMTGAPLPEGADTVVVQELATFNAAESTVTCSSGFRRGQNIRWQGEEIVTGKQVLHKGVVLNAPAIGQLATLGLTSVLVFKPIKISVLSTGFELKEPGDILTQGQIYDSNRYALMSLLQAVPCDIVDFGIVPDDAEHLRDALASAAKHADIVISSAGISTGEADYVKSAMNKLGELSFYRMKIRPGRPLSMGFLQPTNDSSALFIGFPGNPAAVQVTFKVCVEPLLRAIAGYQPQQVKTEKIEAKLLSPLSCKKGRVDYFRGRYRQDRACIVVDKTGFQGAAQLSSLIEANCLIEVGEDVSSLDRGEWVDLIPLS